MYFDIFLISVLLMTVYIGPLIVRRQPPGHRTYGWLLIADSLCAGVALYLRHTDPDGEAGDLLGFVAIAAGLCLVVVPPILRDLARRALLSDRHRLARRLIDLRDLLQPGMGAEREREFLDAVAAVRSGNVDDAIAVLRETRDALDDPAAQRALDERIVFTYLSARRWQDAIDIYQAAFDRSSAPSDTSERLAADPTGPDSSADLPDLADLPALAPQLLVEIVRAYCEVGDLESAAFLIERIESAANPGDPLVSFLIHRAYLMFLAFVGRADAVERLLGESSPLAMLPPASRHFWTGIARLNAGDRPGSRTALHAAARLSRGDRRAREVAESIIESIDRPGPAGPRVVPPDVAAIADRLTSATMRQTATPTPIIPQMSGVSWRRVPVTTGLIISNVVIFFLVSAVYGSTGDVGGLIRAGANVGSAVVAGEWWRLASSTFLHVGWVHLLFNIYVLWVLGKLVEQLYGPLRFFAVYATAGLAGAIASTLSGPGVSVGASGAVLGLMGALIVELGIYRRAYFDRWRKHMLRVLVFVAVAQVAIGFFYSAIDQAAHVGGLLAGGFSAALVSPRSSAAHTLLMRAVAIFLAATGLAVIAYGAAGVATTEYRDTLARYGRIEHHLNDLAFVGPAHWRGQDNHLVDDAAIELVVKPIAVSAPPRRELDAVLIETAEPMVGNTPPRPQHTYLALPEPWHSREYGLTGLSDQDMGGEQRYRIIVFGRWAPGSTDKKQAWIGVLYVPNSLASDVQPTLSAILSSMRQR
ncbi:MAG: rhomboid family intramembrane serine protease [Proteobacteria bacterium]|nr:rhomboid family intramembrane serine protease [Pseudomonadota bacterium]